MSDFTLGAMYWINPKYSLDDFRVDMRKVRENKLTLLRTFIQWEYVEVERDKFDFTVFDPFFQAAEEEGIGLMPTLLFYLPFHRRVEQEKNGRSDGTRRYPCLDRPEIRAGLEQFYTETVKHFKDSPALKMWNLWNEPSDPFCQCPDSLEKFASWLRRKYPTMEALKEAWAGEYYIFNPVLPKSIDELTGEWVKQVLALPLRGRDTAMRLDSCEFQIQNSAEHLAWLASIVRKIDPVHEVHSNPAATTTNPLAGCGGSPWELAKVQDSTSGSVHPHGMFPHLEPDPVKYPRAMVSVMDLIRSWADGRPAWIGEYQAGSTYGKPHAYTPRNFDITAALYHSLARGLKGVIYWEWQSWRQSIFETAEFSLRNPSDGGPTERSEATRRFGEFLEKYDAELAGLRTPCPQVAILHSMTQFAAEPLLDSRWIPLASHYNAAYSAHQALLRAGIFSEFITESQLSPERLSRYKVLILPHVRIIAPETASLLARFVESGGALWADGRCGYLDKHHFLRTVVPGNGLDRVFGCRETDEVAPFEDDLLVLRAGSSVKPWREVQRLEAYGNAEVLAECNGYPAAVRNRYGKGIAELWGTYLTANPETDLSKILPTFAESNGAKPEVRIICGDDVFTSLIRGRNVWLAVFTSVSKTEQNVVAELPIPEGKLLNDASATFSGGRVEFSLRPNETLPLLIRMKK